MKKIIKIKEEIEIPKKIIGISSQQSDYKIAWEINNMLDTELKKYPDKIFREEKISEEVNIPYYFYKSEDGNKYYLIQNVIPGYIFLPSINHINYILLILPSDEDFLQNILGSIKGGKSFLGSFLLNLNNRQEKKLKELLKK